MELRVEVQCEKHKECLDIEREWVDGYTYQVRVGQCPECIREALKGDWKCKVCGSSNLESDLNCGYCDRPRKIEDEK
jgi:hypothetical protein